MQNRDAVADRRIVLIGGAGFIGHNLALQLKRMGAEVSIVDGLSINNLLYFSNTAEDILNQDVYRKVVEQRYQLLRDAEIPLYVQDARDYHNLTKCIKSIHPQVIIHLAAVAHAGRSNKNPYTTFDHSLRTLENALDIARSVKVEHFIFFSSSMVYGHFPNGTVDEDTVCEPLGIYGALKFAGEKMVIAYNQVFDLPYTIVRPSALYGERCVSRRVGQVFIENALFGAELKINGEGRDRLDFTYIDDLVHGIVCVIKHPDAKGETFNLTYGASRSIADMVDILKDYFPAISVEYLPRDKLMPNRGTLCIDKAKTMIGYTPQFPLERGFPRYVQWYKQFSPLLDFKEADLVRKQRVKIPGEQQPWDENKACMADLRDDTVYEPH